MSNLNILVTGGAGFIGSHLVDALVERGHTVRILDSLVEQVHGSKVPEHLNPAAEFVRADVCDAPAVSKALDGIDVVYHEAAEVGVGQSMYEIVRYVKANDLGTAVLLEEIVKRPRQFKKLIVASSMSIYGEGAYRCEVCSTVAHPNLRPAEQLAAHDWDFTCENCGGLLATIGTPESKPLFPTSVYAVTKQDQEQYCLAVGRAYHIPTVAFRYFNVYGTRQALSNPYTGVCAIFSARLLNDQAPTIFEDGEQTRDFVNVKDIVNANLLALETDRGDYNMFNIGTGRATSIKEVAQLLAAGLGKKISPEIVGKYREGDIRHCVADISKARTLLGYEPSVSLEDGLAELLSWLNDQEADDKVETATAELASRSLVR
ncbi:MAG TPA: NAD-dependent epimerase/dehydratase family protein [Pyrinomonadaceae bacterium]|jgi:dTDP-L-rhamnose 4-epimerase|nr:NAD-dependent epimerase/dehydratase family protein [Pyrinomonadaceae bacterium]